MTKEVEPQEEMDLDALDSLDIEAAEKVAEVAGAGGAEVFEASNVCESGACSI